MAKGRTMRSKPLTMNDNLSARPLIKNQGDAPARWMVVRQLRGRGTLASREPTPRGAARAAAGRMRGSPEDAPPPLPGGTSLAHRSGIKNSTGSKTWLGPQRARVGLGPGVAAGGAP